MDWVIFPCKPRAASRKLTPLLSFSLTGFGTQKGR